MVMSHRKIEQPNSLTRRGEARHGRARPGTAWQGKARNTTTREAKMEKIERIKVATLILDYDLYPRAQIDGYHVNEMVEGLKAGTSFPPIIADAKSKRVIDGFHRVKALQKLYKEAAEADVMFLTYKSEAEMYEAAMKANSSHGRNLTSFDKAHSILKGKEFGLTDLQLAKALNVTVDRVAFLIQDRWTADKDVLKKTVSHFAGTHITQEQREFIPRAGGLDQLFYISQVIALLQSDSIDWTRDKVRAALKLLQGLLKQSLKGK